MISLLCLLVVLLLIGHGKASLPAVCMTVSLGLRHSSGTAVGWMLRMKAAYLGP